MNTNPDNNISSVENEAHSRAVLEWTSHPMRKRPIAAVLVTVFILVISALVFSTTMSKAFTLLALIVLFMSLAKFYMPTKYKLTDKLIIIKSTTQTIKKEWKMFRSFYPDKNGVLLSPFATPSRLENFRGMFLIFSDNKDEVLSFIKDHITDVLDEIEDEKDKD